MDQALFGEKEIQEVSSQLKSPFLITSAKDGRNVNDAFQNISSLLVDATG